MAVALDDTCEVRNGGGVAGSIDVVKDKEIFVGMLCQLIEVAWAVDAVTFTRKYSYRTGWLFAGAHRYCVEDGDTCQRIITGI